MVVAVFAVLATVGTGVPVPPAGASVSARRLSAEGRYALGVRSETFVDATRPTSANGSYPGAPTRTLVTTIWYPAAGDPATPDRFNAPPYDGRFPLVVFAHGFTADGPTYGPLLRRIASAGFVVAAPTFPLSNGRAPGGPRIVDVVNQPADVSFVIDELLRLDADGTSPYAGRLRRNRIAAAGHSLGGVTTLGLLNDCCLDPRIDAYIPMSGVAVPLGGAFSWDQPAPILLVHGESDAVVPFAGSLHVFDEARRPKYLLALTDGSHVPFNTEQAEVIVASVVHFLDRYVYLRRSLHALIEDGNVPGVSALVQG